MDGQMRQSDRKSAARHTEKKTSRYPPSQKNILTFCRCRYENFTLTEELCKLASKSLNRSIVCSHLYCYQHSLFLIKVQCSPSVTDLWLTIVKSTNSHIKSFADEIEVHWFHVTDCKENMLKEKERRRKVHLLPDESQLIACTHNLTRLISAGFASLTHARTHTHTHTHTHTLHSYLHETTQQVLVVVNVGVISTSDCPKAKKEKQQQCVMVRR